MGKKTSASTPLLKKREHVRSPRYGKKRKKPHSSLQRSQKQKMGGLIDNIAKGVEGGGKQGERG